MPGKKHPAALLSKGRCHVAHARKRGIRGHEHHDWIALRRQGDRAMHELRAAEGFRVQVASFLNFSAASSRDRQRGSTTYGGPTARLGERLHGALPIHRHGFGQMLWQRSQGYSSSFPAHAATILRRRHTVATKVLVAATSAWSCTDWQSVLARCCQRRALTVGDGDGQSAGIGRNEQMRSNHHWCRIERSPGPAVPEGRVRGHKCWRCWGQPRRPGCPTGAQ